MKFYWRRNIYGWILTGIIGGGGKWFIGHSQAPEVNADEYRSEWAVGSKWLEINRAKD